MNRILIILFPLFLFGSTVSGQTVMLDSDFDADGIYSLDWDGDYDVIDDVLVQPDGKILAGGYMNTSSSESDFALIRLLPDGSLDTGFSFDGKVNTDLGSGNEGIAALALQPDGKIVAAGYTFQSGKKGGVTRYNADGTLDLNFNASGKLVVDPVGNYADIRDVAVQPDGKILLCGSLTQITYSDFFLMRLKSNGTPDSTFGTNGWTTTDFYGFSDAAFALAIQSDGKIVVTGYVRNSTQNTVGTARYLPDGSLDSTFSVDGKIIDMVGLNNNAGRSVHVFPSGEILVGVQAETGSIHRIGLIKYLPGGAYDNTFGVGGFVDTTFGGHSLWLEDMRVDPTGKILVGGRADLGIDDDFFLARFLSDGTPDATVFPQGMITTDLGSTEDYGYALAIQPNGRVLVGGSTYENNSDDFGLVRYIVGPDVSREEPASDIQIASVFPNPIRVESKLKIQINHPVVLSATLLDLQGREVSSPFQNLSLDAGNHEIMLNFPESLPKGYYFLKVEGNGDEWVVKMMK